MDDIVLASFSSVCGMTERHSFDDSFLVDVRRKGSYLVNSTLSNLLSQEDTLGTNTITIKDTGPGIFRPLSIFSFRRYSVSGTYALSNLLQELYNAKISGMSVVTISHEIL